MALPTNPLTFNDYSIAVGTMAVVNLHEVSGVVVGNNDAAWDAMVPSMLSYAENRVQRDLDLNQLTTSDSYNLTANSNLFSVPVEDFVTIQTIATTGGPLLPVSKEFLQNTYPSVTGAGYPQYFAPYGGDLATAGQTSTNFLLGPWPNSAYAATVTGTIRAPSLYKYAVAPDASTLYTFISSWFPELLVQASLIYVALFQRNFLPTSNDPEMLGAYEGQYQNLLKGSLVEEGRRHFAASGWTSYAPPVIASANR